MSTSNEKSDVEITVPQSVEIVKEKVSKLAVVPYWKTVFKTYSFWFYVSSILITFIDQILPLMGMIEPLMTGSTYIVVVFSLNLLGVLARFVQQRKIWQFPQEIPKDA